MERLANYINEKAANGEYITVSSAENENYVEGTFVPTSCVLFPDYIEIYGETITISLKKSNLGLTKIDGGYIIRNVNKIIQIT